MSEKSRQAALDFIANEKQFHLGFLPTEQSNPLSRDLDKRFAGSVEDGVRCLQNVDRVEVLAMAQKVFASKQFAHLVETGTKVLKAGHKICFSGCGATGRLSILLECMWRRAAEENAALAPYANQVFSIMTGGDYALVRSVEFFEDYQSFGRRQVQELNLAKGDMLVAITEGGETSSVLGTVFECLDREVACFLMFNNPADVLAAHLERSRKAIEDPRVTVLDLSCGPMALAGSTRMQATTSEQLVAGGALEAIACGLMGQTAPDYAKDFGKLLSKLEGAAAIIAAFIMLEAEVYRKQGYMTYFADDYLLDIFTDTTERSPTFMLPPFRKSGDTVSAVPWAFVKNPLHPAAEVWKRSMKRPLRCLEWTPADYEALGAPDAMKNNPPAIRAAELLRFEIGNEPSCERHSTGKDAAVLLGFADAPNRRELEAKFNAFAAKFAQKKTLTFDGPGDYSILTDTADTPLSLMRHMAVKLVLNTVSTGVMVVLGRVSGNWMSFVDCTNKKLIDRATRLISELGNMDYQSACIKLYEAMEAQEKLTGEKPSLVQQVLNSLK